jgi:hypothetical protein
MADQSARADTKACPAKYAVVSRHRLSSNGQENIDVVALLGITDPGKVALAMRRLGWAEADIKRWLGI